ncbi:PepSY domain-containing protein [Phenylobacterium aquaticum]|uniref:PepSY domain-containing protein n=1 Tax=Phenylobacterium aquaticum TaxID=1763816 RepID=UPI001F5C9310|nr:PepSY domain-containing protein [Phenylobacterium aquaticum]MCI3130807.1 PepSY domain-containing protein [Phenylobacterium aquaticum]
MILFLRWLHKWIGLIVGLQFVLWTFSGAAMALLDHHKVAAEGVIRPPADVPRLEQPVSLARVAQAAGAPILRLELKPLQGRYVYEAATTDGVRLIDAADGRPVVIDADRARSLAVSAYRGAEPVRSVAPVTESTFETRTFARPVWRVEFADKDHTALFVSAGTGQVLGAKNDAWRLWDFVWMIHIMDYTKRESFNHPLIITVATGIVWLALSGLILLFRSFRRSDFSWVLDPIARLRAAAKTGAR